MIVDSCPTYVQSDFQQTWIERKTIVVNDATNIGKRLITKEYLCAGDYIAQYTGELISIARSAQRDNKKYMIHVEAPCGLKMILDASIMGNNLRYTNHSCEPNMETICKIKNGKPVVCMFALRNIGEGEELTLDYYPNDILLTHEHLDGPCLCGTKKCRYK